MGAVVKVFLGAFQYSRAGGQSPVGLPKENGTTFSYNTGPIERNGSYHFFFLSRINSYIR